MKLPRKRSEGSYIALRAFTDTDGASYAPGSSYPADGPSLAYLLERGCLDAPVTAGAGGPMVPPAEPTPPDEPEVNDGPTQL